MKKTFLSLIFFSALLVGCKPVEEPQESVVELNPVLEALSNDLKDNKVTIYEEKEEDEAESIHHVYKTKAAQGNKKNNSIAFLYEDKKTSSRSSSIDVQIYKTSFNYHPTYDPKTYTVERLPNCITGSTTIEYLTKYKDTANPNQEIPSKTYELKFTNLSIDKVLNSITRKFDVYPYLTARNSEFILRRYRKDEYGNYTEYSSPFDDLNKLTNDEENRLIELFDHSLTAIFDLCATKGYNIYTQETPTNQSSK